jgi:predicted phosphodiesterase
VTGWEDFGKLVEPVPEKAPKVTGQRFKGASVEFDGSSGEIDSGAVAGAANWDDLIRHFGLNPDEVEVVEPVRQSAWDAQTPDGIQTLYSYRARLQSKRRTNSDVEQIMADVMRHKAPKAERPTGEYAFLHLSGDLQAGKEGSAAMIQRFMDGLSTGPARLRELRRSGKSIGTVVLPWLGDCVESTTGHYAQQTFTVELSMTEQVRLVRRLMMKMVQAYAPLANEIIVAAVPGNHDQAVRNGAGKSSTNWADSWAIDIASTIHDAIELNPAAYGHVKVYVPEGNDPELTLDVCGTLVGMAHGHTFKRDIAAWWAGQALGGRQIGEAQLLLAGHLHHLRVHDFAPERTYIQIPALDSGSEWFAHSTGLDAPPGIVTLTVGKGGWADFQVLR